MTGFFLIRFLIPGWHLRTSPFFPISTAFADDYLQIGYSYMLDISQLFNNNTLKCIKAKTFPFNQK